MAYGAQSSNDGVWNLHDADIKSVIKQVSVQTGKNFILDPRVQGKITVISSQGLSTDEMYQVFLSVLQVMGFAAIDSGNVIKIVPDNAAKSMASALATTANPGVGDEMVVRVIPLKYVSATALIPVLRNLVSSQGHLSASAGTNVLIVADRASTASKLAAIIKRVDVADSEGIEYFHLDNAGASEVVDVLRDLLATRKPGGPVGSQVKLAADDRTNTVIISGDKNRRLAIRAIIAQLDGEVDATGNTEVIYLKYQKAEDMVPVLSNIIRSYYGAQEKSNQGRLNVNTTSPPISRVSAGTRTSLSSGTNLVSSSSSAAPSLVSPAFSSSDIEDPRVATGTVIGGFGVHAEPNTNSLIISAPPSLMRSIKAVIAKLDVRRAQVLVEGVIVELQGALSKELGIEWRTGGGTIGGTSGGSVVGGILDAVQAGVDAPGTLALPTSGLTLGFIRNGSIRFLLSTLESMGSTNILATPSVVALDNAAADLFVGQNVPIRTGEFLSSSSTTTEPFTTIERRDVGLRLRIVPQITKNKAVKLLLQQFVETVDPSADADVLEPTFTTRSLSTTVLVNDGDILVLGGLIRSDETETETKVPGFGDLPGLGVFFKSKQKIIKKTNLMIFLRPIILRDQNDSIRVTTGKYNFIRDRIYLQGLSTSKKRKFLRDLATLPPINQQGHNILLPEPFAK